MEFSYNKLWKLLIDRNMVKRDTGEIQYNVPGVLIDEGEE